MSPKSRAPQPVPAVPPMPLPPPAPVYAAPPPGYAAPAPVYAAPPPYAVPRDPRAAKNWMNTVSLIASLVTPLFLISWLPGIIFGHLGVSAARRGEANNKGMGVTGLIIGYAFGVLGILIVVALVAVPLVIASECSRSDAPDWCTSPTYEYEDTGKYDTAKA